MSQNWECCDHPCYHDTGLTLTSNPPINVQKCCNCGKTRQESWHPEPLKGHGPFAPQQIGESVIVRMPEAKH